MELHTIEAQIRDLQSNYESEVIKQLDEKLGDIKEHTKEGEDSEQRQMQFLMDTIRGNSATWSGGSASLSNMLETIRSSAAQNKLNNIIRGY